MSTTTLTPRRTHTQNLFRRYPPISFLVLTYAVAWLLWAPLVIFGDRVPGPLAFILLLLGSLAPSTVGVLFVALLRGRSGVRTLFGRLLHARIGLRWYLAVVALAVPAQCAVWVSTLLGGTAQRRRSTRPLMWHRLALRWQRAIGRLFVARPVAQNARVVMVTKPIWLPG
jgi:hypothetical protein